MRPTRVGPPVSGTPPADTGLDTETVQSAGVASAPRRLERFQAPNGAECGPSDAWNGVRHGIGVPVELAASPA